MTPKQEWVLINRKTDEEQGRAQLTREEAGTENRKLNKAKSPLEWKSAFDLEDRRRAELRYKHTGGRIDHLLPQNMERRLAALGGKASLSRRKMTQDPFMLALVGPELEPPTVPIIKITIGDVHVESETFHHLAWYVRGYAAAFNID